MSSLRRILSLDNTDYTLLSPHTSQPKIARHSSLPILTLFKPHGLLSLPLPPFRSHVGQHERSIVHCSYRTDGNANDLYAPPCPVPAWLASDHRARIIPRSLTMKESLDVEDSIVYRELRDSIRTLEVPSRYVGLMNPQSEAALQAADEKEHPFDKDVTGRPLSLRMLRRKGQRRPQVRSPSPTYHTSMQNTQISVVSSSGQAMERLLADDGVSVKSAFASMVFMMETLQQHTLWLKRTLMTEADACLHDMLSKVQAEIHETFLWLFQKVFACTPKLMLLTMMLLVDFTAHSMGSHVALAVTPMGEPPTVSIERPVAPSCTLDKYLPWTEESTDKGSWILHTSNQRMTRDGRSFEPRLVEGGEGNGAARNLKVGGAMDGEAVPISFLDRTAMTEEDDSYGGFNDGPSCNICTVCSEENENYPGLGVCDSSFNEEYHILNAMWKQVKDSSARPGGVTRHMLVAPVRAPKLEADDYACYDRTDLTYQHELSRDPGNPLLLANYAQFLHVVRHDHPRAEDLYKRAVRADPVDGEAMGRYASFLWVAKEDVGAADEAYRAALEADPSNAFHAGSYAHFLWNSGAGQDDTTANTMSLYQHVSTS